MQGARSLAAAAIAAASLSSLALAQEVAPYTDEDSGITFATWSAAAPADYTFGIALPEDALENDATEYIGILRCSSSAADNKGWCGFSHGQSGQMTQALLVVAWPHGDKVLMSLRYADGYTAPVLYEGDAVLTQISSKVDDTGYEVIYRCQNCFAWNQKGIEGSVSTSQGYIVGGRAQSNVVPENSACPSAITYGFHSDGFGQWGAQLASAVSSSYAEWAALATTEVSTECVADETGGGDEEDTETPVEEEEPETPVEETPEEEAPELPAAECTAVAEDAAYDYVVIGAGAGGITVAERLVQAGNTVLLIEKGPPSTARWGGTLKPEWLEGEDLTRFDVPGLCNQIWHDSTGIVCTDMDQIAGCVLGGGTAVNAGLWWKPHPSDWDDNFPAGWKNDDVAAATRRVFTRIPGTTHPSMDGYLYQREGFDVLADGLEAAGWGRLDTPNSTPDQKNHTFGHTTFMFSGGERGGPLATYLVTASRNPNFQLWTDTDVTDLVRDGDRITGVEVSCTADGGRKGVINIGSSSRVILSAGVFGSAKLLMFAGIGPADQLAIVQEARNETFIAESEWIDLPVGENLMDHLNTDVIVEHDAVVQYNYTEAWWDPIESDAVSYLQDRSGILAAAAPNIGPMIWDEIEVSDGSTRSLQWTCRMEGSLGLFDNHTITMSQYLGRGVASRGRMALTPSLTTRVATLPYLRGDEGDREAIIQGLENIRAALKDVDGLRMLSPADNVTSEQYVDDYLVTVGRRSNHWMGTNKLGEDDGREGGSAVVDTNTKVYGMTNLFVVDGSIMPGMMVGNPSAMIVILAEHASEKIMALELPASEEEAPEAPEEEAPEVPEEEEGTVVPETPDEGGEVVPEEPED